jgi:hypothetical protein
MIHPRGAMPDLEAARMPQRPGRGLEPGADSCDLSFRVTWAGRARPDRQA